MGTIPLEEANAISTLTVCGFGLGLVFIGLICIILICLIMGALCKKFIKEDASKAAAQPTQAAPSAPKKAEIANKGEVVAAIAAAIAEDLGEDVSGIRILSINQL